MDEQVERRLAIMRSIYTGIRATMYKTITITHRREKYVVTLYRRDLDFSRDTHLTAPAHERLREVVERYVVGACDRDEVRRVFQTDFVPAHAVHFRDDKPVYEPTVEEFERMKDTLDLKDGERVYPDKEAYTTKPTPVTGKASKNLDEVKRRKRQRNRDIA